MDRLHYSHGITRTASGCHRTALSINTGEVNAALVALDGAGAH